MIAAEAQTRRQHIIYLAGGAFFLWFLLGLSSLFGTPSDNSHARMGNPIITPSNGLEQTVMQVRLSLADDTYSLVRGDQGWRMPEAANFPVRQDRITALLQGLETLSYGEARTSDPDKHEHLGLGAPSDGGTGVAVDLLDAAGETLSSFLIGRRNEQLYVRFPNQDQTYRARGTLPAFYNRRAWLDFDIISIEPSTIGAVRLRDALGDQVYLRRTIGGAAQSFRPAPPDQDARIISRLGVSTTALALSRFAPRNVKPAQSLATTPIAQHITETYDGLEIVLEAYREADGNWATLRAIEAGEGARRAADINRKANMWAFELSTYDFEDFVPRVSRLVARPEQDVTQP